MSTARPLLTFHALLEAKRNGQLGGWLAEMTSAERVEAAQICAANGSPRLSVSDWLRIFGELMDAAGTGREYVATDVEVGVQVQVANPMAPDFGATGTLAAIHYADSDCPSYIVSFGDYCRPYGRGELNALGEPMPASNEEALARQHYREFLDALDQEQQHPTEEARDWRIAKVGRCSELGYRIVRLQPGQPWTLVRPTEYGWHVVATPEMVSWRGREASPSLPPLSTEATILIARCEALGLPTSLSEAYELGAPVYDSGPRPCCVCGAASVHSINGQRYCDDCAPLPPPAVTVIGPRPSQGSGLIWAWAGTAAALASYVAEQKAVA